MRSIVIVLVFTLLLFGCKEEEIFNPVFTGNVELKSQQEVDAFAAKGYTEINGSLLIGALEETDIIDLRGLKSLTKIQKELSIFKNGNLTNLEGLNNISIVGKNISIYRNSTLKNLDGLNGLKSIGSLKSELEIGEISIFLNSSLEDIDGLSNVKLFEGYLSIKENLSLANLNGLRNISGEIIGLNISRNNELLNISGLSGITSAGNGWFTIEKNPKLNSLDGLENIKSIRGHVSIMSNNAITNLKGFDGVTEIGGSLRISGNYALLSIKELGNLTSVGKNPWMGNSRLEISINAGLVAVDGLEKLKTLNGILDIGHNKYLRNFCAIKSLLESENLIENGEFNQYRVSGNAYNPTIQNILDGKCYK